MENSDLLSNDLQVSHPVQSYLLETAKWAKFLSILGFIGCGVMIIFAFIFPAIMSLVPTPAGPGAQAMSTMKGLFTVIYLVLAILFFFPCLFLYRFSIKVPSSLRVINQEQFEESLMNLKSTFKFYGIVCIVILSFYALAIIVGIIGAMFH
jgi:hypothetical protein